MNTVFTKQNIMWCTVYSPLMAQFCLNYFKNNWQHEFTNIHSKSQSLLLKPRKTPDTMGQCFRNTSCITYELGRLAHVHPLTSSLHTDNHRLQCLINENFDMCIKNISVVISDAIKDILSTSAQNRQDKKIVNNIFWNGNTRPWKSANILHVQWEH